MTIESIFIMLLNIAYCVIIPWFLYYAYKDYKLKKAGEDQIYVYSASKYIPHKWLLTVTTLYVTAVTLLLGLLIFGVSDLIKGHWFAYVYALVIAVAFNHDRVSMLIGNRGITADNTLIPLEQVSCYEFKDLNTVTNRWTLEIHTGDKILRGIVPSESRPALESLLDNK